MINQVVKKLDKNLPINEIIHGNCIDVMKTFPDNSIDCVVTDPPYGMSFMGKDWDKALPPIEAFKQMYRVLKPGALAFVMSSPRQDLMWRMMKLLEDSGFEMKQSFLSFIYKTGFPKAYDVCSNVTKRIDNYIRNGVDNYDSWEDIKSNDPSKTASIVEKLYLKNLIETGINTTSKDTVANDVSAYLYQRKLNVDVNIVEKRLNEVQLTSGITFFVVENADTLQEQSNLHVNIATKYSEDRNQILTANIVFVRFNAQTFFTQQIVEIITKEDEALKIENGEKWFWNETGINALIVEVLNDFKHTISNQLKNTQNLDMIPQTESPYAINVIITESIKECLTSVMVDILGIKIKEKYEGLKSQTGLKPATEPILMVNKPFSEKTIVENVLKHGVGAINVDACRIPVNNETISAGTPNSVRRGSYTQNKGWQRPFKQNHPDVYADRLDEALERANRMGRFPANLLVSNDALNDGELSKSGLIEQHHKTGDKEGNYYNYGIYGDRRAIPQTSYGDEGSKSRYFDLDAWAEHHGIFDVPKPDKAERDYGLKGRKQSTPKGNYEGRDLENPKNHLGGLQGNMSRNTHPTVKPIKLMAYLIELGCPRNGIVLDPFLGSGTTCIAAKQLTRKYIGIELNEEYFKLANARIKSTPTPLAWGFK